VIPKELRSLEVLGIGIRSEMDARRIYEEMALRISNPKAKGPFHLLVAKERHHQTLLERKYRELLSGVPQKLPPSLLRSRALTADLRRGLSQVGVLDPAVQQERCASDFNLEVGNHAEDLSGKVMLNFLGDWEYAHQMMLTV
jgi:rubrerythrin